jgi:hypothetical protein
VGGWVGGWVSGWVGGWVGGWVSGWVGGWVGGWGMHCSGCLISWEAGASGAGVFLGLVQVWNQHLSHPVTCQTTTAIPPSPSPLSLPLPPTPPPTWNTTEARMSASVKVLMTCPSTPRERPSAPLGPGSTPSSTSV